MYQKEIVYMNLFENDIKNGCVGYFKIEKKQESFCLELQVKNVSKMFTGNFPIRLQGENDWNEAGMLSIKDGCGKWTGTMEEPIARAEVILTDTYRIKGECKNVQVGVPTVTTQDEAINNTVNNTQNTNNVQVANSAKTTEISEQPDDNPQVLNRENTTPPIMKAEKVIENSQLYENKWEQLLDTYEQIHPYGDSRVYVKLEPKDFIVLRSNYQHLVNNSFLLHGFYNYRYVILGKEKDFYIGVPGVFYEREKMVALMFGFEAFECEGGDAEEGKFGYYLRKVEI